jgi:hypothetical protein
MLLKWKPIGRHELGKLRGSDYDVSEADDLKEEIRSIAFDVNRLLSTVAAAIQEAEVLGNRVLATRSHNQDVAIAGGTLTRAIPEDFNAAADKLRLVYHILDTYGHTP